MLPPSNYGADRSGLIYGYQFSADGSGREIDTDAALQWLQRTAGARQGFVWLNFNASQAGALPWLNQHVGLSEAFLDALHAGPGSTRIELAHNALIAVINDVVYDLSHESTLQVSTLWLNVGPDMLLSVRSRPLRSVDRLRGAVKGGELFSSPMALVNHLLRDQADSLVDIVRKTTENIDRIEDHFLDEKLPERASLGLVRRDLVRLQRLLAPEPAALFRLLKRRPDWIAEDDALDLQTSTEEFSVVLRDMAGLQERIKLLQEEIVAHIGERTNRSVFVLTAVTVVTLPINLTSGLFGMNVGGVPFGQNAAGFWIVVLLVCMATVTAGWLAWRVNRAFGQSGDF